MAVAATLLVSCEEEKKEPTKEDDLGYLMERLDDLTLPPLREEDQLRDTRVTRFAEEKLPQLGEKWRQIRYDYNTSLQVINFLEYKRALLLSIASMEDSDIDLNSAPQYLKILGRLRANVRTLKMQHEKISPIAERFFAESAVRDVWSDDEMQEQVSELIRSADNVLEMTRLQTDLRLEGKSGKDKK